MIYICWCKPLWCMYMHKILCCLFDNNEQSVMIIISTSSWECFVRSKTTVIIVIRCFHAQLCKSGVDIKLYSYVDISVVYEHVCSSSILA